MSEQSKTRTVLVANQPPLVLHVCACCLSCGNDPEMALTPEPPVSCKTCGFACCCPGCRAEHHP
jgi:hypothetical protein